MRLYTSCPGIDWVTVSELGPLVRPLAIGHLLRYDPSPQQCLPYLTGLHLKDYSVVGYSQWIGNYQKYNKLWIEHILEAMRKRFNAGVGMQGCYGNFSGYCLFASSSWFLHTSPIACLPMILACPASVATWQTGRKLLG